jgi:hypothetical protein
MWSAKVRGLSRGRCRGGQLMTAKEGRKTMWRNKLSGLMLCALVLVAVGGRGYAAETIVKASSSIKGEGRFYKATDQLLLFSGYFQGGMLVEDRIGDVHEAGLVCPALLEINHTAGTQQGAGRCIIATRGGEILFARWTCTGKPKEGCAGLFTFTGGTEKFSKAGGESQFALRSNVMDVVTTVPERDVTASFTGDAVWGALKYTTP